MLLVRVVPMCVRDCCVRKCVTEIVSYTHVEEMKGKGDGQG